MNEWSVQSSFNLGRKKGFQVGLVFGLCLNCVPFVNSGVFFRMKKYSSRINSFWEGTVSFNELWMWNSSRTSLKNLHHNQPQRELVGGKTANHQVYKQTAWQTIHPSMHACSQPANQPPTKQQFNHPPTDPPTHQAIQPSDSEGVVDMENPGWKAGRWWNLLINQVVSSPWQPWNLGRSSRLKVTLVLSSPVECCFHYAPSAWVHSTWQVNIVEWFRLRKEQSGTQAWGPFVKPRFHLNSYFIEGQTGMIWLLEISCPFQIVATN